MCRTGHRIFIDPQLWSEEAAYEVTVLARSGNADASQVKLREFRKIRRHRQDSLLRIELRDVIESFQDTLWFESKPFQTDGPLASRRQRDIRG